MKKGIHYTLIILMLLSVTSCFKVKELKVQGVESVKVLSINNSQADLAVTLRVHNPNNMKITVKSMDLDAYVNKKYVGKVNTNERIIIPKKSDQSYTVMVKADMNEVRKLIPTMIFASQALINLQGGIKVKTKGFNKSLHVNIDEKISRKDLKGVMSARSQ